MASHRKYYVTPKEFMHHLEAAARETYFQGKSWEDDQWHPEDIANNLESVLTAVRGYLSSAIWHEAAKSHPYAR